MTRKRVLSTSLLVAAVFSGKLTAQEPIDFHRDIFPFLEARCFKCHSDEKQKGDLRMDSPAWIMRGSENGDVVIPGDPDESTMYYLTTYPDDDPDYMPSKGKGLTKAEQELLRRWIAEGASFGEDDMDMGGMMMSPAGAPPARKKYTDDVPLPPASYEVSNEIASIVSGLESKGIRFDTVNHDAEYFEITYTYADGGGAYDFKALDGLAGSLVKLNYARSDVQDKNLMGIDRFSNLTYVDLRKTGVSDQALVHLGKLASLEYLNLFGTQVTDEGLRHLNGLKNLKQIYLWGTSVSEQGIRSLEKAIPGIEIIN